MTSQFHPPKGGFHNQRRDSYRYHGKKIKNHNDPSVSFSHGLLGDVNFDFAYLNSNGKRTKALIDYWNRKNKDKYIYEQFKHKIGNYRSPIGYAQWDWVNNWLLQFQAEPMLMDLAKSMARKNDDELHLLSSIEQTIILSSSLLTSNLQPIYLTRAITEDLARTDFKGFDAPPNDIYPVYTFMLPKSTVSNSMMTFDDENTITDDFYTIIVMSHKAYIGTLDILANSWKDHPKAVKGVKAVLNRDNYVPDDPRLNIFEAGFKMIALSNQAGWCIGDFIWKEGTRDWQIIVSDKNVNFDYDENKPADEQHPKDVNDGKTFMKMKDAPNEVIGKNLLNIAANSILLMDHQPEYITQQSPLLGGRGFNDTNPPKPSTWLGEHYEGQKIRYEYPPDYVPEQGKSPRSHWRRGHMRHVCQGKGRKQRVLTWIKPVFIVGRGVD